MSGCGIFWVVVVIGLVVIIPFALKAADQQRRRIMDLRNDYSEALLSGTTVTFIEGARSLIDGCQGSPNQTAIVDEVYQDTLAKLKENPDLKPFALEVGRIAYGLKRKDKMPTVYDEQAIRNDIDAHL